MFRGTDALDPSYREYAELQAEAAAATFAEVLLLIRAYLTEKPKD